MRTRYFALVILASVLASACAIAGGGADSGSLTLKAGSAGSRTIAPASGFIASYSASGSGPSSVSSTSSTGSFSFTDLAPGSWTFTVSGLDAASNGNVIATGTAVVTISSGASASASVTLAPASSSYGSLSLSASWSSGEPVSSIDGSLSPDDGSSSIDVSFTVSGTSATYSNSALAPGSYVLALSAKDSSGAAVASATIESVLIYAGQSSSATLTISDAQFIVGSSGLSTTIPSEITLALSGNSSSLSRGSTMTVTATPSAAVDSYAWYLDGTEQSGESSSSITFGSSLGLGSHRLMAVVKKNAIPFSNSCAFTVLPVVKVSTLAGSAGSSETTDGTGTAARFNNPWGLVSYGGYLYIADTSNNSIRKMEIETGAVTTFAGSTSGESGSVDGTGTSASFSNPTGIATDGSNLYVADGTNHTIRKIVLSSGVVSTLAGTAGSSGTSDGTGTSALFYTPYGLACDGSNLYVSDYDKNNIRKIVINTGAVTTLAGSPSGAQGRTDATGTAALFNFPRHIATDGIYLYVADYGNKSIRKVAIASGAVTTLAGSASGASGTTDGTGTAALFNSPAGLTTDGFNLYVTEFASHTIRKIVIGSGVVSTLAGSAGVSGSTDGAGTDARFKTPFGITLSGTLLFVADSGNYTIRKITQE